MCFIASNNFKSCKSNILYHFDRNLAISLRWSMNQVKLVYEVSKKI